MALVHTYMQIKQMTVPSIGLILSGSYLKSCYQFASSRRECQSTLEQG